MASVATCARESMAMVLWRPEKKASLSLVPTPSVPETSTGCFIPPMSGRNRPPKPPISDTTPLVIVRATCFFISSTAL